MSKKVLDRISEGYKGELGQQAMVDAKTRIGWICENIVGETVLDVGCSQGIVSILLAREGKNVAGIVSEISRIEYAEEEKRNAQIAGNLNLICGDFLTHNFGSKFDTIIMGEVLEHVFNPNMFLNKAKNLLKEKGRLIVTVPFGINPFPDHKRTYYFLKLFKQINEKICVVNVCFFGNWIGFVADINQKNTCIDIDEKLIQDLENSFYVVDARKQETIDKVVNWHKSSSQKLETANTTINELKKRVENITNAYEMSNKKIEEYVSLSQEKEKTVYNIGIELISLKAELGKCKESISEKENTINKVNKTLEEAKEKIYHLKYENKIHKFSLKTIGNEKKENEKKIDFLNDEIDKIKAELNGLGVTVEEKDKKIRFMEEESLQMKNNISLLEKANNALQEEISAIVEEKKILKKNNEELVRQTELLKEAITVEEKKSKELNNRLYVANKLNNMYERLIMTKAYNVLRKLKRKIQDSISKGKTEQKSMITVIIPTYRDNPYIEKCINSVLYQNYFSDKVDIIISVNGENEDYYHVLKEKCKHDKCITVIYDRQQGAAVGRNNAVKIAKGDFIFFLDDDDYITQGLLAELAAHMYDDVDVVCGKMNELQDGDLIEENTYINCAIEKAGEGKSKDHHANTSLFVTICGKLYRTTLLKEIFSPINENFQNTEDVIFWAENAYRMKNSFYVVNIHSKEAYIRRTTNNSLSRPSAGAEYKFYIEDRINIIEYIEQYIYDEMLPILHKRFVYVLIQAQENHMLNTYNTILDEEMKGKARNLIYNSKSLCLNKGKFSNIKGIAFCHNFSPFIDASAFVATKRLIEISEIAKEMIKWDVISADMSGIRKKDIYFDMFFANSQYENREFIGKAYWNEKAQYEWGVKVAAEVVKRGNKYKYIYSRSMWPASHVAAYHYKKSCPDVIWYAECSDPIYMTAECKKRKASLVFNGDDSFLNDFWYEIECIVFENADKVILNNENQKYFMKEHNESLRKCGKKRFDEKCIVKPHPVLPEKWNYVIKSEYNFDKSKINIAYFGSFYDNRGINGLFKFLNNKNVRLHIFSQQEYKLDSKWGIDVSRVRVNGAVSQLECLNIGSKMDYLYIEENQFPGERNPYLHSKLADYITTGTPIIANILCSDSPIEKYDSNHIIKLKNIDDEFVNDLRKTKL